MGFRSLLEISHDDIRDILVDPTAFVKALNLYVHSADHSSRQGLAWYGVKVVALRHSGDRYIIPARESGFPTQLPFEEFITQVAALVARARERTGLKSTRKAELEQIIGELVAVIERLEQGEEFAT